MKKGNLGALLVAVILLGFSANSQAITITTWNHDGGSTPANYTLNVGQTGMQFNFDISVDGGTTADLYGFYLNVAGGYAPLALNAMVPGATLFSVEPITICGYNTTNCGMGNNLNGEVAMAVPNWDVAIQFGSQGLSGPGITFASFSLPSLGLGLDAFESFGIRSQTSGPSGCADYSNGGVGTAVQCGSDKAYALVDTPPVDVPEPASMALMGLGLVGLGLTRRKRKTS